MFIPEPRLTPLMAVGVGIAERVVGRRLLPARLLAWFPRAAVGSAVLESLVARGRSPEQRRLLHLTRLAASIAVNCPFGSDMNGAGWRDHGVTADEVDALRRLGSDAASFSVRERAAIDYAQLVSAGRLTFPPETVQAMRSQFSEREFVMVASTAAQVKLGQTDPGIGGSAGRLQQLVPAAVAHMRRPAGCGVRRRRPD